MGELSTIGFCPGRSPLHRLDPRTKQALLMGLSLVSFWGGRSFLLLVSTVIAVLFYTAGLRPRRLVREMRFFLFFLALVVTVRTVIFSHGWMPGLSLESAGEALILCWRLLLVVGMGLLVMATTRTAEIRTALAWYLKPIPFINQQMAATMVGLVVRLLPMILFQAGELSDALRARGIQRRKNPLVRVVRFTMPLFRRVFLSADDLAAAMQARCYSDHRTPSDLALTWRDGLALGAGSLLCLSVFLT